MFGTNISLPSIIARYRKGSGPSGPPPPEPDYVTLNGEVVTHQGNPVFVGE